MFTHFFGNYLYSNKIITKQELKEALEKKSNSRIKMGVLAINKGLMTAMEVHKVLDKQTQVDMRFGEIAIEMGYLNHDQVAGLIQEQRKSYLLLAQALLDISAITYDQFEESLKLFKLKYSVEEIGDSNYDDDELQKMVARFVDPSDNRTHQHVKYLTLLIRNLVRFIGDDFVLFDYNEAISDRTIKISQLMDIVPAFETSMYAERDVLVHFVSRFLNENISDYSTTVENGAVDFLNLHNGLYSLTCDVVGEHEIPSPEISKGKLVNDDPSLVLRVLYPFGEIAFDLKNV